MGDKPERLPAVLRYRKKNAVSLLFLANASVAFVVGGVIAAAYSANPGRNWDSFMQSATKINIFIVACVLAGVIFLLMAFDAASFAARIKKETARMTDLQRRTATDNARAPITMYLISSAVIGMFLGITAVILTII